MNPRTETSTENEEITKASSIEHEFETLDPSILQAKDFHPIDNTLPPRSVPKRSKPFSLLTPADENKEIVKSFNPVNLMKRNGKNIYYKDYSPQNLDGLPEKEVEKAFDKTRALAQLEAANGRSFHFLIGDLVPRAHSYYNKDHRITGLGSVELPNFQHYADNPLKEHHLIIKPVEEDIDYQRTRLREALIPLSESLNRQIYDETSLINTGVNCAKYYYNYYTIWNKGPTAPQLKPLLDQLIAIIPDPKQESVLTPEQLILHNQILSRDSLYELLKKLELRQAKNDKEAIELHAVIVIIKQLVESSLKDKVDIKNLNQLYDKYVSEANSINTSTSEVFTRNVFDYKLKKEVPCSLTLSNLKNFELIKHYAAISVANFVKRNDDAHKYNFGPNGLIDFDSAKWDITYEFKYWNLSNEKMYASWAEWMQQRKPDKTKSHITANNIDNLPLIIDVPPYYSPAHQTLTLSKNSFSLEDNKNWRQLINYPPFEFFKFYYALKEALTPPKIWQSIADLEIDDDLTFPNSTRLVKPEYVHSHVETAKQLREELLTRRHFRTFLEESGEYVIEKILQEFAAEKMEYETKVTQISKTTKQTKTYYQPFVDALDLDTIKKDYETILHAANSYKLNTTATEETPTRRM